MQTAVRSALRQRATGALLSITPWPCACLTAGLMQRAPRTDPVARTDGSAAIVPQPD